MRLGDVIDIKHGYAFSGEHITEKDNNVVLVTPGNFKIGGGFQEKKCKFFDGEIPHDYVLKGGDFIVTMTDLSKTIDTLGYSALVPQSDKRMYLHNQRIGLVLFKNEICDRGYIYWLMRTHRYQREIANTSTGSTVHHTSPTKICDYEFDAPPLEIQHRIAFIFSRYDSLIENYQKQIKLLEESAQRLYKEWFVDLRFPGHENTKIVDGVPEGWEKKKVGDIVTIKSGFAFKSKDWQTDGFRVVKIKDINGMFVNSDSLDCVSSSIAQKASQFSLNKGELVIAMTGATIGKIGIVTEDNLYTNQRVGKFFAKNKKIIPFLYCFFKQQSTTELVLKISSSSAAQPNISGTQLESFTLFYNQVIVEKYCTIVSASFEEMIVLQTQIRHLTEARDRLLPKLMSGKIEV